MCYQRATEVARSEAEKDFLQLNIRTDLLRFPLEDVLDLDLAAVATPLSLLNTVRIPSPTRQPVSAFQPFSDLTVVSANVVVPCSRQEAVFAKAVECANGSPKPKPAPAHEESPIQELMQSIHCDIPHAAADVGNNNKDTSFCASMEDIEIPQPVVVTVQKETHVGPAAIPQVAPTEKKPAAGFEGESASMWKYEVTRGPEGRPLVVPVRYSVRIALKRHEDDLKQAEELRTVLTRSDVRVEDREDVTRNLPIAPAYRQIQTVVAGRVHPATARRRKVRRSAIE